MLEGLSELVEFLSVDGEHAPPFGQIAARGDAQRIVCWDGFSSILVVLVFKVANPLTKSTVAFSKLLHVALKFRPSHWRGKGLGLRLLVDGASCSLRREVYRRLKS